MEPITMARELGKLIQQSVEYQALSNAKKQNDEDVELNNMIHEFNLVKLEIQNLMSAEDADKEKINAKNQKLSKLYQTIMAKPNMMVYQKASEAMNLMMNQINTVLVAAVNGEDPETCDVTVSCGGDCGSCAGCH